MTRPRVGTLLLPLLCSVAVLVGAPSGASAALRGAGGPCAGLVGTVSKVLIVVMENETDQEVIGAPSAPYQTELARSCALATQYRAIAHPSLPNYLAMTGGSTFGVTTDTDAIDLPVSGESVFEQMDRAGKAWVAYAESMPSPCDQVSSGEYAARHNPAVYYTAIRTVCERVDVPMGALSGGAAARAIAAGTLPGLTFVAPNVCDDAHSCPESTGDAWLSRFLPEVFAGPQFRSGELAVLITYDEGVGTDQLVPFIAAAREIRAGSRISQPFNHYSLLATVEQILGLPRLGAASRATSMSRALGLR